MPLYEYQCQTCGVRFERRQHISDKPVKICPECGGEVRRLIQPVGIIFKGSGFYVTDNRAKSSTATPSSAKKEPKEPEKDKSASTTTSTTTSETKSKE
ncbi:MAG: zinc ribbon domain-containing protein [Chloroflexi bacterium]|nr:MAG: zinc ribbon domain-containing protein [Chloroflexota bacterium]HEY73767.1 zinc ribbon domain-containing protein [Thermoflexia bacterium]